MTHRSRARRRRPSRTRRGCGGSHRRRTGSHRSPPRSRAASAIPSASSSWPAAAAVIACTSSAAESLQRDPLDAVEPSQIGERRGQRMLLGQVGVSIRDQQLQRPVLEIARDVLQQRHRLAIRPLEVIEHDAQRHRRGHRPQQLRHGLEQQEALGLRIRGLSGRSVRNPAGEVARQPRHLAAVELRIVREHVIRCVLDDLRADRDPRLIRRREILAARTPADRESVRVRAERGVGRQPGLPDPRLARQQHHLPGTRPRMTARDLEQPALRFTTDVRDPRHRPQRLGQRPPTHIRPGLAPDPAAPTAPGMPPPAPGSRSTPARRTTRTAPRRPARAAVFVSGEMRIPSVGALSHNRAASIDGIPK